MQGADSICSVDKPEVGTEQVLQCCVEYLHKPGQGRKEVAIGVVPNGYDSSGLSFKTWSDKSLPNKKRTTNLSVYYLLHEYNL